MIINILIAVNIALGFIVSHMQNDLINPSFADMINYFQTNPKIFHLMSSSYFLGISISSLIVGPLSDSYGRKNTLIFGFIFIILGLSGIIFSSNVVELIFWRFIQGIGIAAPVTVLVAVVFDRFNRKQSSQLIGIYDGIITSAKALSPICGGYINVIFGWKYNFYILIILSISVLLVKIFFLKETLPKSHRSIMSIRIFKENYMSVILNKRFMVDAVILGSMACCANVYLTSAPIIFINYFGVEREIYGYYHAVIMASFAMFSFATSILISFLGLKRTKIIGLLMVMLGAINLIISAHFVVKPLIITLLMATCNGGFAILIAIIMSDAMHLNLLKGYSSAVIASVRLILVSSCVAIAGYFFNGTMVPTATLVFVLSMFICVVIVVTRRMIKF